MPTISRWEVIVALIVGLLGGVIIGAIPGVGPAIALILLLPVLAKVAPMFGSRQIFLASLLGMVLVIVTHLGTMLRKPKGSNHA